MISRTRIRFFSLLRFIICIFKILFLLESGLGEGIFFAGQKHAAIQVVASYTEDQIVTTDPNQLLKIEAAKKEFQESLEAPNVA